MSTNLIECSRHGASGVTKGYEIDNSLRFEHGDSANLSRTPSTAGNRKTWTWSGWVKRDNPDPTAYNSRVFFSARDNSNTGNSVAFTFDPDRSDGYLPDRCSIGIIVGSWAGASTSFWSTNALYRDTSAWYHVVVAFDTTEASFSNRIKLWVNGEQITSWYQQSNSGVLTQNSDWAVNDTQPHFVGRMGHSGGNYKYNGYMAEVNFIDGQALTPSDFGEFGDYGEWKPVEYTGTYGTNGFYLDFKNTSTKHTITAVGDAQHSTTQNKIGSSSMYFDGSDVLTIPDSSEFSMDSGDWTLECWIRRNRTGVDEWFFMHSDGTTANTQFGLHIDPTTNYLEGRVRQSDGTNINISGTTAMGAGTWYHTALVRDGSTIRMYLAGVQEATSSVSGATNDPSAKMLIGAVNDAGAAGVQAWIDEVRFSNTCRYTSGTTFTPSTTAFTEDSNTLLLIHSDTSNGSTTFTDDSGVAGALGNDASSNSNNWTTNNISASDQMVDTPTNNFATLNPLDINSDGIGTLSEGNLKMAGGTWDHTRSTYYLKSGKWYWECLAVSTSTLQFGVVLTNYAGGAGRRSVYQHNATKYSGGSSDGSYGATFTNGDIIGVSLDLSTGTITFYKNNVSQGAAYTDLLTAIDGQGWTPATIVNNSTSVFNFGQDSSFAGQKTAQGNQDSNSIGDFYYAPPTDFLALCSANLPDPTVIPSEHFNTVLYTGTTSGQSIVDMGFSPDLVWIKNYQNAGYSHQWFDVIRGATKDINSNSTEAEQTITDSLTSFDSDGFTLGADAANAEVNNAGRTYVAWNWKAGGTAVSNTDGSITSSVSANTDAGFSIVSYTGTGSAGTVGHGLSQKPDLTIFKDRDAVIAWIVEGEIIGSSNPDGLRLSSTEAKQSELGNYNNATATLLDFPNGWAGVNTSSDNYIAYCFHSVDGYSKMGSYTGNGSTDGTFIHTGFSPAYVMIKASSIVDTWIIMDDARSPFNPEDDVLYPNTGGAESVDDSNTKLDFLSNGFKLRHTNASMNSSGATYIFLAFAEMPFKHSNAR